MRALLVCPDEGLRNQFLQALAAYESVALSKIVTAYPDADTFTRMVRVWAPEVVFLSMEGADDAEALSLRLQSEFPGIQRIAVHSSQESAVFHTVLRLRMQELLVSPFDPVELGRVLDVISRHLKLHPATIGCTDRFFAFVPAKAGVGASTVAANATWAFSALPGETVLLADFDIYSGVTGFMYNAAHEFSILDAAARTKELDEEAWQRLVKKVGNIDLLLSGAPHLGEGLESRQIAQLIEFVRRNYSIVSADLPDTFDATSVAVMREASKIFLVTTPDLTALRLAKLKTLLFRRLDLEDKVVLLVNRATRRMELSIEEIESTVGLPVFMSFPCDYADVTKSIRAGKPANKLAESVQQFAEKLLDKRLKPEKRTRFIERFAVVPARHGFR